MNQEGSASSAFALRDYQRRGVDGIVAALTDSDDKVPRVLFVSATGSGKTAMATSLVEETGLSAAIIVERKVLAHQWRSALAKRGIESGLRQGPNEIEPPPGGIRVCMQQTMAARAKRGVPCWPTEQLIIVDEAHVMMREVTEWIRSGAGGALAVVGMTATPTGKGMADTWRKMVQTPPTAVLTAAGWLVPPRVFVGQEVMRESEMRVTSAGEFDVSDQGRELKRIVGDVARHWLESVRTAGLMKAPTAALPQDDPRRIPKTVLFSASVSAGKRLVEEFNARIEREEGIPDAAIQVSHLDKDDEREEAIEGFSHPDGHYRILVNVSVAGRGFDCPDAAVMVDCAPFRTAFGEYLQRIGRVLRPARGSAAAGEFALILDFCGNWERLFGPVQRAWRLGWKRSDLQPDKANKGKVVHQRWLCRPCSKMTPLTESACQYCGEPRGGESGVEAGEVWDCPECPERDIPAAEDKCPACLWEAPGDEWDGPKPWKCPLCRRVNDGGETACATCGESKPEGFVEVEGKMESWQPNVKTPPVGCHPDRHLGRNPDYGWRHVLEMAIRRKLKRRKNLTEKVRGEAVILGLVNFRELYRRQPPDPWRPVPREPLVDPRIAKWFDARMAEYAEEMRMKHGGRRAAGPRR